MGTEKDAAALPMPREVAADADTLITSVSRDDEGKNSRLIRSKTRKRDWMSLFCGCLSKKRDNRESEELRDVSTDALLVYLRGATSLGLAN
jgi:hypothetical protein